MRRRIVLLVVLAVLTALLAVYAGWSRNTPKTVGEPATATPSDSSVGSTQSRASGSGPARSPAPSSPKAAPPKAAPPTVSLPKATPPKAAPPKAAPPKACSATAAAQPAAYATPSGQEPATNPASKPQPGADRLHFGPVTPEGSHDTFDVDVSDDRRALTAGFDDLELTMDGGSTECDATRSFAMTLPLTGSAENARLRFHAQGSAFAETGASARLTLRGNGRVKVKNFPAGSDDSFVQTLELPAIPATTYQLSAVIEVHQDPGTEASAYLNILAIDIEIG